MPAQPTPAHLQAARAAYHRYCMVTNFKNFLGNPVPAFDELPLLIQCAWAAAANVSYDPKATS